LVTTLCAKAEPALFDAGMDHLSACHLVNPDSGHPRLAMAAE
jgi:peptide/nickel transport system ATP-binding protein